MKIRVVQGFGVYAAGQVFEDWPAGMCDILIRRGLIEQVLETAEAPKPQETETADVRFKRKK
jgi:hypothetical protein